MRTLKLMPIAMALLLAVAAGAQAHVTVTSSGAPSEIVPGEEYAVGWTASASCAVIGPMAGAPVEYEDGQELTFGIANGGDYVWLNGSEENQAIDFQGKCLDPANQGAHVFDGTLTFTVAATAPAFETFTFQPGAFGETNEGGSFDATIAYNPAFTAPTALSFDAVAGGATATIPLTMAANADSVFNFDVTSFTFNGETASEDATAHIQETLEVATGIATEEGTTAASVDLHFGAPGGEDHMDHDAMEEGEGMDHEDHDAMEDHDEDATAEHFHWETAEAVISVTLAAKDDATLVSEAQEIVLTFTNTDADSMPHDDMEHTDGETDGDESNFLPGFELVAVVAALGAVAALRRRG